MLGRGTLTGPKVQTFEKDFYLEHPSVAARTAEDVEKFRKGRDIFVEGSEVPRPVKTFEEAPFPGENHADILMLKRHLKLLILTSSPI